MSLGEHDAAIDTLRQALNYSGYEANENLAGDEITTAIQLANAYDRTGNVAERDRLLEKTVALLNRLRQSEPPSDEVHYASACVASIQNDLPAVLMELTLARENGFRRHWQLIRNPVFERWQDNAEFTAFYQDMIKSAETMRSEYKINNPGEIPEPVIEGVN